jgi:hypothetical protein
MRFSRLVAILGVSGMAFLSSPAFADKDHDKDRGSQEHHDKAKELIRTTIRVLETRDAELDRTIAFDTKEAKELEAHAVIRDRSSATFAAEAKKYRDLLAKLPANDPLRAQIDTIASGLESDSAKDKEFATQRRAAGKILTDQAAAATEFIRLDKISIDHYKSLL